LLQVPGLLFNSLAAIGMEDLKKSTSEGIIRICKENCNNPPLRFLEGITTFYMKNDLKQDMKNVIDVLKHSVSIDNVQIQKYVEIWTCFTKALVKQTVQWNQQPTNIIDFYLQNITLDENNQLTEPMSVVSLKSVFQLPVNFCLHFIIYYYYFIIFLLLLATTIL
jgi:hypothetical protein